MVVVRRIDDVTAVMRTAPTVVTVVVVVRCGSGRDGVHE